MKGTLDFRLGAFVFVMSNLSDEVKYIGANFLHILLSNSLIMGNTITLIWEITDAFIRISLREKRHIR